MIKDKEHTMLKIKKLLALLVLTAISAGCGQAWGMEKKVESLYPSLEENNDEITFYAPTICNNYDDGNPNAASIYPILNDNKIINKVEKRKNKPCVVFSFFKEPKNNEANSVMVWLKRNNNTYTLPTDNDLDFFKGVISQFIIKTIDAATHLAKPLTDDMLFDDFMWVKIASHTQKEDNFAPDWSEVTDFLNNQQECSKIESAWDTLGKKIGEKNENKIEKNEKPKEKSDNKNALILEIAPENDGEMQINAILVEDNATIAGDFGVKKTLFDPIYTTEAENDKLNDLKKYPFATAWSQEGEVKSYLIAFKNNCWEEGLDAFKNQFINNENLLSDILADHENPPKENEDVASQQSYFPNIFSWTGSMFGNKN